MTSPKVITSLKIITFPKLVTYHKVKKVKSKSVIMVTAVSQSLILLSLNQYSDLHETVVRVNFEYFVVSWMIEDVPT